MMSHNPPAVQTLNDQVKNSNVTSPFSLLYIFVNTVIYLCGQETGWQLWFSLSSTRLKNVRSTVVKSTFRLPWQQWNEEARWRSPDSKLITNWLKVLNVYLLFFVRYIICTTEIPAFNIRFKKSLNRIGTTIRWYIFFWKLCETKRGCIIFEDIINLQQQIFSLNGQRDETDLSVKLSAVSDCQDEELRKSEKWSASFICGIYSQLQRKFFIFHFYMRKCFQDEDSLLFGLTVTFLHAKEVSPATGVGKEELL